MLVFHQGEHQVPQAGERFLTIACRTKCVPLHAGNQTLVVLIGNSKNLWPSFLAACCQETGLLTDADPLDTYVEQGIRCATQTVPG